MLDGLIIAQDKSLYDEININIATDISYFEYADSVDSASKMVEFDVFDYVIVIERDAAKMAELIKGIRKIEELENIPVISFTAQVELEDRHNLWQLDVKDIVELPVAKDELKIRLEKFFLEISEYDTDEQIYGMQGKLEDYNLLDIVQTMEQNKKTGIVTLYHGRDEGRIWFNKGKICDAQYRTFANLAAIFKLATWIEGDFTITFDDEDYEEKIMVNNQQVLLDAIQYIDKRNKLMESLPDLHETLLISPETDMDLVDDSDLTHLKFFQGGQTIAAYLFSFDEDELNLLERNKYFLDSEFLMTREQFDSHTTEQEKEIGEAGIKHVFKKLFRNKSQLKKSPKLEIKTETKDETTGIMQAMYEDRQERFTAIFNREKVDLQKVKNSLEKI